MMLKNCKYLIKFNRSIIVFQEAQINSLPDIYTDKDAFKSKSCHILLSEINKPSRQYYRSCLVSNIKNLNENHINKQFHTNLRKTACSQSLELGEFNYSSCRKLSNSADKVACCSLQNNSVNFSNETILKSVTFKDSSDVFKQGKNIKEVKTNIPIKTVSMYNVNTLSYNFIHLNSNFNPLKSFLFMKFKTHSNLENYKFFHTQKKMPFNYEIRMKGQKQTFLEKRYYSQIEDQFECPYCHQSFSSRALLESHVMYTHSTHSSETSNTSFYDSLKNIILKRNVNEKENSENKDAESESFENKINTDNSESKINEINNNADNKLSDNKESGRNKNNEIDEIVVPSDGGGGGGGDCM